MESLALKLTENIPIGVYTLYLDDKGAPHFSFISKRCLEILDLERDALLANHRIALERLHPDDKASFVHAYTNAILNKSYFFWEGRAQIKNTICWIKSECTPHINDAGHCTWSGILTDITDLKASQLKLQEAHKELVTSEVNRSKLEERERMLQDLHDGFGSNLNTALLRAEISSMTQEDFKQIMEECLSDLYLMVDTLADSNCTIKSAVAEFRYRTQNRMEQIKLPIHWHIELESCPEIPHFMVLQILRVGQEALNNIIKHSHASQVHIYLTYHTEIRTLLLKINDNGDGFSDTTRNGKGLSNMKNRARKIGGSLSLQTGNHGTSVELTVPLNAI